MSEIITTPEEEVNNVFKVIDNVTIVKFIDGTLTKIKVADDITTAVTNTTEEITNLTGRMTNAENDILNLKQDVAAIEVDTTALLADNNANKVEIEINKQNITQNSTDIDAVKLVNDNENLRLNTLEQNNSHLENDISTLNSKVDANSLEISFHESYINRLTNDNVVLDTKVTNIENEVNEDHIVLTDQEVHVNDLEVANQQQEITNTSLQNQITQSNTSNVNWDRLTNLPTALLIALANNFEYLVFNPSENIIFNNRYKIDWANVLNKPTSGSGGDGITWPEAIAFFLAINPENPTALHLNYTIIPSEVIGLDSHIEALISAKNFMLNDPGTTTVISPFYTLNYNEITNPPDLTKYLEKVPTTVTTLHLNYRIPYAEVTDAPNINLYMLITPPTNTALNSNYTVQWTEIQNKPDYLLTNPTAVTTLHANYRIPYSQVTNAPLGSDYMKINPGVGTAINSNYSIDVSRVTGWPLSLMSTYRIYTNENGYMTPEVKNLSQIIENAVVDPSTQASQNISAELFRWNEIAIMKATEYCDGMYYQNVTTPNAMENVTQYITEIIAKPLVPGMNGNPYENVEPEVVAVGATISDSNIINNENITTLQYGVNVENNQAMWSARTGVLVRENSYVNSGSGGNTRETMVYVGTMYNTLTTFSETTSSYPNSFINGENFNNSDSCKTGLANSAVPTYEVSGGRYMGCDSAVCTPWSGIHIKTSDGETSAYLADGSRLWAYTPADSMTMSWSDEDMDMDQSGIIAYITPQGDYVKVSSMAFKENVREKTNNLKVLNKILKLDVITYTYKKEMGEHKKDFIKLSEEEENQLDSEEREKYKEKERLYDEACKRLNKKRNRLNIGFSRENMIEQRLHYAIDGNPINKGNKIIEDETKEEGIGVEMTSIIPYLTMAIKGLNEKIEEKDKKIKDLEERLTKMENAFNEFNSLFESS